MDISNVSILLVRRRYNISESSSSDEDWKAALRERGKRKFRPRIIGYVDEIVGSYNDHEFKSHFTLVSIDNFCFFQIFNIIVTVSVLNALYFQLHLQVQNKNN